MNNQKNQCDWCLYYLEDTTYENQSCQINLDEDELARLAYSGSYNCPYFRFGDDYTLVKKQI